MYKDVDVSSAINNSNNLIIIQDNKGAVRKCFGEVAWDFIDNTCQIMEKSRIYH